LGPVPIMTVTVSGLSCYPLQRTYTGQTPSSNSIPLSHPDPFGELDSYPVPIATLGVLIMENG
jgi:hypothetical protein